MRLLPFLLLSGLALAAHNVRDFGARGDGTSVDTGAIQAAIDAAAGRGGGEVVVPAGRYLSGTIRLKNNITLRLENGATIAASLDNAHFAPFEDLPFRSVSDRETTYFRYGLITAENAENIAITGQGTIDGNRTKRGGPKTVALKLCRRVAIRGVTVRNSPNYSISLWGCDDVDIDGVTVLNGYSDGIDPDSCRFVRISNCYIDAWDDAICPKASPSMGMNAIRHTENLVVTNCVLRTSCSNFKFGTESSGNLRNVTVSNIVMLPRETGRRPISGISLESVDGAHIDGVSISNVVMQGVSVPVFVRLGNRGRGLSPPVPGSIRNVSISSVTASGAHSASSVTGIPGYPVRDVTLSGFRLTMEGGERGTPGLDIPEHEAKYPEATMFGLLPAWGLYARHAEGLALRAMSLKWVARDARPAMLFDDVRRLTVDGFETDAPASSPPLWLNNVVDALLRGSHIPPKSPLARMTGRTKDVAIVK